METYTKHEIKLNHHQETPLMAIGQWMSAQGFDPRYLKQEIGHAVEKNNPSGVVENQQGLIAGAIDNALSPAAPSQLTALPQAVATQTTTTTTQLMATPQSLATLAPL
jgi:hypothetical protein